MTTQLNPYEAVADGLEDGTTPAQVEAAIGLTSAGSLSDGFWAAWDAEIGRLLDFFESVQHEPEAQRRMGLMEPTDDEIAK